MNPVFSVVCSALHRASTLIECGHNTAEALKRASEELERYANAQDSRKPIPESVFNYGPDVGVRTLHLPNRKQS